MFRTKLDILRRLGFKNIVLVAIYRIAKRLGYFRLRLPLGVPLAGPFLTDQSMQRGEISFKYFSYHARTVASPPDWFLNPWNNQRFDNGNRHWSAIPDFMQDIGDIKTIWELSRFDWAPSLAWKYRQGDADSLKILELWLRDWAAQNPVNTGINWKCGQEASLRCLNLLVAAKAIDHIFENPRPAFLDLLDIHLQRIEATMFYALAQDNNHGISEAAALFVVGKYLTKYGNSKQRTQGRRWEQKGRYWLEDQVSHHLIMPDGSFSQHSVNYHRLVLDLLSVVDLFRIAFESPKFSEKFYDRVSLAVGWLHGMTDPVSGNAPNLGANDGAYLFNLNAAEYRDFRPSVQLAAGVFLKKAVFILAVKHPLLELFVLDISKFPSLQPASSVLLTDGGYARINSASSLLLLRLPNYLFRPSHADALHVDMWQNGINWIRDAGSYSYNATDQDLNFFQGTGSHSTVSFDGRDQMPRMGRFLFGSWLRPDSIKFDEQQGFVCSSYTDYLGAHHKREIRRWKDEWCVIDEVGGFEHQALLRWRLAPENWILNGQCLSCKGMRIEVVSDEKIKLRLIEQFESQYYLQKDLIPVLEVTLRKPGQIISRIQLF